MDAIPDWFRELYQSTGLNFTVFYDAYDWNRYVSGLKMTLLLSVTTILLSLVIGAIGALIQSGPSRLLRGLVNGFVVIFRNTPPLVQLFFFYFGLGTMLPATETASGMREPLLNNVQWAIISLSLFAAAFNVEIFRSGIEAVPKTTIEAAEALGYKRFKAYRHIVLPLAIRVCLPALNNNLVNLLKTTTLAYAIAVPETLYALKQIWSESQNVLEMMILLLATYGVLVGVLVWLMQRWERAMHIPGYHR
ncbi:amino acid ABC transporter permease [Bradyrhizobium erythrophlei]|jgi:polar amino acid transport system permease protein|uniref:Amino acid ABC transporter membrane protein 1, PAAT family n=1 Tax=Bradyrhizobium erythrophlei TaxID=1437360 RepID=A0A1M7TD71_9BRAD|nr:amino acid ABC transporter permease [Bradyrhizobium erythrophlei]SHN68699.1 amino acid ABC transporter membrane protein 1, PAAT family [Bradyrhizobium erythrophlei]